MIKKIIYLFLIMCLLCNSVLYARDVIDLNWPEEEKEEEYKECNERNAYVQTILSSVSGEISEYFSDETSMVDLDSLSEIERNKYFSSILNTSTADYSESGAFSISEDDISSDVCPSSVPSDTVSGPSYSSNLSGSSMEEVTSPVNFKRIILELKDEAKDEEIQILKDMGCKIEISVYNLLQVSVDERRIENLKKLDFIKYFRFPVEVEDNSIDFSERSSIDLEDFSVMKLGDIHKNGYMGQNIKVAVLDTAFDPASSLFKENVFYTMSFRSQDGNIKEGNIEHGNAVVEILTRIAPKAKVILVNFQTDVEYIKALKELINQPDSLKPDIILTSVNIILPDDYYDGTGIRASLARLAQTKGITLVTSAGNNGQTHYNGKFLDSNFNLMHNFTSQDDTLEIELTRGDKARIVMAWKDSWEEPKQDLALGFFNDNLEPVKISDANQIDKKSPPYEILEIVAPYSGPYHIAIKKGKRAYEGLPFMLYIYSSSAQNMEYFDPQTSLDPGLPTSGDCITVGAVRNQYPYELEPWSSQGKTTDNRLKPDLVALSGIYCLSKQGIFWGTSSAAPQVAGAIALLLNKKSSLTPEEIKSLIKKTAIDLGEEGEDPIFGAGLINIYKAINSI